MVAAGVFATSGTSATASSTELVVVTGESPVLDITSMWYLTGGTLVVIVISAMIWHCFENWKSAPMKVTSETQTDDVGSQTWISVVATTASGECFHMPGCDIITNPKRTTGKILYRRACAYCVRLSFRG